MSEVIFYASDGRARALLEKHGLARADVLLEGPVGEVVSSEPGREVRRLRLAGGGSEEVLYLKRRGRESWWRLLGMLVIYGRRPCSGPLRERALVRALSAAGFATMEPVAWGERRVLGMPIAGFLLVKAVEGKSAADVYQKAATGERSALMRMLGELTGRLHRAGFLHPVRLKDLIVGPHDALVLIDRESGKPWAGKFTIKRGLASLARATRRTLRDGHRIGPEEARALVRGYAEGCGWNGSRAELARQLMDAVRVELAGDKRRRK